MAPGHLDTRRGRTWRPTRRPVLAARRAILAAGRTRSKVDPSSGSKSRETPPARPASRSPEAERAILLALMRYWPDLLRWARRCGVSAGDAPDVAQLVALRAWRGWETSERGPEHRAPWLFTIVARVASQHHRRAARAPVVLRDPEEVEHAPDAAPLPNEPSEAREDVATIEQLRAGTTAERWRVFFSYEVEGVTAATLAKREAIPVSTVYNRLRLARRDVRAVVDRDRAKRAHAEELAIVRRSTRKARR